MTQRLDGEALRGKGSYWVIEEASRRPVFERFVVNR